MKLNMIPLWASMDRTTHEVCTVIRLGPAQMRLLYAYKGGGSAIGHLVLPTNRGAEWYILNLLKGREDVSGTT